jgi:hypothetical protein
MYLPVLLDIDRPIVVLLHGRVIIGLVATSVVARLSLIHVHIFTTCLLRLPCRSCAFGTILCCVRSGRAGLLCSHGLWICLRCRGRCRGCWLGRGFIVVAGDMLAMFESHNARVRAACKHLQIVEDIILKVLVGHVGC